MKNKEITVKERIDNKMDNHILSPKLYQFKTLRKGYTATFPPEQILSIIVPITYIIGNINKPFKDLTTFSFDLLVNIHIRDTIRQKLCSYIFIKSK